MHVTLKAKAHPIVLLMCKAQAIQQAAYRCQEYTSKNYNILMLRRSRDALVTIIVPKIIQMIEITTKLSIRTYYLLS